MSLTKTKGSMLAAGAVVANLGYTPLAPSAIGTTVQGYDADLAAIAALTGTSGLLKTNGAGTWSIDTAVYLTANQTITVSGDATGSGSTSIALTLAASGVTAGTYPKVTVDAKGRVTAGSTLLAADLPSHTQAWSTITSTPTTLAGYGITDALKTTGGTLTGGLTLNGGDLMAYRTGGTTGVVYLNSAGTAYVYWDGAGYQMPTGNLTVNGSAVVTAGNVSSYALPTAGGSMGGGTFAKNAAATTVGNISFDNGTTDTPGLHFYTAANTNFGIDVASSVLRFVKNLDETGGVVAATVDGSGNFTATANVTAYSDERKKTNWRPLADDFVERLANVKHGIYDRTDDTLTQVGVSAQSLRFVMPNAVLEGEDGFLSVAYGNAALTACVALAKRVVALEARIAAIAE